MLKETAQLVGIHLVGILCLPNGNVREQPGTSEHSLGLKGTVPGPRVEETSMFWPQDFPRKKHAKLIHQPDSTKQQTGWDENELPLLGASKQRQGAEGQDD